MRRVKLQEVMRILKWVFAALLVLQAALCSFVPRSPGQRISGDVRRKCLLHTLLAVPHVRVLFRKHSALRFHALRTGGGYEWG
jgi:hypothetical protein